MIRYIKRFYKKKSWQVKASERGHFFIFVSDLSGSTEKKIEDKNKGIDDVNDYHNRVLDVL